MITLFHWTRFFIKISLFTCMFRGTEKHVLTSRQTVLLVSVNKTGTRLSFRPTSHCAVFCLLPTQYRFFRHSKHWFASLHPNPLYRCSAFPFGIAFKMLFLKAPYCSVIFHPHAGNKTAASVADNLLSGFPFGLLAIFFVLAKPLSLQRLCFFKAQTKTFR